jgi:hypothetical protein
LRSTVTLLESVAAGTQQAASPLAWTQIALVAALLVVIGAIAFMLVRTGMRSGTLSRDERTWLDYGNLFVVALGIGAVTVGFLVILLFLDQFADDAQALGFLTAMFGAVVGLVGTYFGVKNSADSRESTERVALASGAARTAPTVTIAPAKAPVDDAAPLAAGTSHTVTATVISVDGSSAAHISVTFKITAGPDAGKTGTSVTDDHGLATYKFTNNGTAGTDTIEAAALGGSGKATATFT